MLSMTMTFAENETAANLNSTEAYNMTVNMKKLSQALSLSKDQIESVAEINKTFSAEMQFAAQATGEERQKMVEKAVNKDLAWMNYILNHDQYRKYLMLPKSSRSRTCSAAARRARTTCRVPSRTS